MNIFLDPPKKDFDFFLSGIRVTMNCSPLFRVGVTEDKLTISPAECYDPHPPYSQKFSWSTLNYIQHWDLSFEAVKSLESNLTGISHNY